MYLLRTYFYESSWHFGTWCQNAPHRPISFPSGKSPPACATAAGWGGRPALRPELVFQSKTSLAASADDEGSVIDALGVFLSFRRNVASVASRRAGAPFTKRLLESFARFLQPSCPLKSRRFVRVLQATRPSVTHCKSFLPVCHLLLI